jgi:hypothetical protein
MNTADPALAIRGLDRTGCTILQAATRPEVAQRIASCFRDERGIEVRPEQVRCAGCRGDPTVQWSDDCETRACADVRGLHSCAECPDPPCAHLSAWAEGDDRHTMAVLRLQTMRTKR